jgi:transposase
MNEQNAKELEFAAFVGWDWADQQHELRLQVAGSAEVEREVIKQDPTALFEWIEQVRKRFGGARVAIAIEQSRGPVVYALMAYDFLVIYPINPKSLARYREAFRPSKAKDDPFDAELALDLLTRHRDQLKSWQPDDELTRTLRLNVEHRREMVNERTRLTNRVTSVLKCYFPQGLRWAGDLGSRQACDFLSAWPTLEAVREASQRVLQEFYSKYGCRHKTIEQRLNEIREAVPLTTDRAVISALARRVKASMSQVRCLTEAIAELDGYIEELFANHPDHDLFASFPGAGKVLAPRLSVAFGTDRSRYESAEELQRLSGIAPVTKRSGKSLQVRRRYARPKFMHQSFVEFAEQSITRSPWAKAFYKQRRQVGNDHYATLRTLAYKWQRIIYRCWIDRVPYDEQRYQMALSRAGSPLAVVITSEARTSA